METKKKLSIEITRDGPYRVSCDIPLNQAIIHCDGQGVAREWSKEKVYGTGDLGVYYLCRCGHSETKPFCDGHHLDNGFLGTEGDEREPYTETAMTYEGPGLDLLDDEDLCAGAGFCKQNGTVWEAVKKTDDPALKEKVREQIFQCPGGRLTARTKDGEVLEPHLPQGISLVEDPWNNCRGPLWVQSGFHIEGCKGESYETRNRMALCRCGESNNKPFCDASHYDCEHMQGLDE